MPQSAAKKPYLTQKKAAFHSGLRSGDGRVHIAAMIVEVKGSQHDWHLLEGALVGRLNSGVYEVTVSGPASMWLERPGLFDQLLLRIDGQEVPVIVAALRESDVVVLRAFAENELPVP